MPVAAPSPPRQSPPPPLPPFVEPVLLIVASFIGIGVVYRVTESVPVTLIAAALAAVVGVAAGLKPRVYWYPTRHHDQRAG